MPSRGSSGAPVIHVHDNRRRAGNGARAVTFAEESRPLDQPEGPLGFRLLVLSAEEPIRVRAETAALVLSMQQRTIELSVRGKKLRLDAANWAVVPAGTGFGAVTNNPSATLVELLVHPMLCQDVVADYQGQIDPATLDRYLSEPRVLKRTTWVHELAHRYAFERSVCKKADSLAARFLRIELLKELYFNSRDQEVSLERSSRVERQPVLVERAINHVEAHLFEDLSIAALADVCRTSPSTLLRAFRRALGTAPSEYVRQRRLEEAALLLKSHRYSIGEVAERVGYNQAAFSHAFRAQFGCSPTEMLGNVS